MRYEELNVFGTYISPIVPMMIGAWLLLIPLRRLADRFELLRYVWHPALFLFSAYLVLLSVIVLVIGGVGS